MLLKDELLHILLILDLGIEVFQLGEDGEVVGEELLEVGGDVVGILDQPLYFVGDFAEVVVVVALHVQEIEVDDDDHHVLQQTVAIEANLVD